MWAEGTAGAKALRQDRVCTSPGGRPAGLGRESRGRGVRPACRPPRGSAAASGDDGSQGQGEHSRAVTPGGHGLLAAGGGWARGGCGQDAGAGLGLLASALGQAPLDSPPPRHLPAPQPRQVLTQKALPAPPRERPGLAERDVQKPPTLQLPIRWILLPDRVQEIRSLLLPGLITASRAAALAAREIPAACKAGLSAPSSPLSEAFNLPEIITHLLPQEAGDRPAPSPGAGNSEPASATVGSHLVCSHQGHRRLGSLWVWASAGPNAVLCWAGVSTSSSVKWLCDTCRVQSG